MKIYFLLDNARPGLEINSLQLFMVEDKFCFYHQLAFKSNKLFYSETYDIEDFVKKNIKIFKRLKYTKERMIKDGCWMKNEAALIKELF